MRNDPDWMNWMPTGVEWAQLSIGTRTGIVALYEMVFQNMLLRCSEIEKLDLKEIMQHFIEKAAMK